ncbi:citrate synthase [Haloterrigena alkaliphila]|uniref:Citrate synthase n=1 Tax=Haloterrigena alkaliphila TaxID=2816475 RepID=A0A8A2VHX6_9EURY|nr:citrate synthase [Haloterrigena alkaliphila]QSW99932.1 citrate synthase [Haloterrigena alkaliphila]
MADDLKKGLEGVLVAESGLSTIDGDEGRLIYRGYPIEDLARGASYEEVVYLLWHGELPTADELEAFIASINEEREVSEDVLDTMERLAAADEQPMAALRTAVSMFSATEPEDEAEPEDLEATLRKGRRITAKIPTALAAFERYRLGEEPVDPHPDLGLAANFLYMMTDEEPSDVHAETFDQALILHADHGLNASTFTSMVIGSTMADIYSAVTGGVSALSGPLHGGANQDVMEVLFEIDESDLDHREWVKQANEEGRRIPGFGHRVYNVKDPRAKILQERSKELAEEGDDKWYNYTTTIEQYLTEEQGLGEKGIAPNVDFYSGSVYYQLGIPIDMYTPIFAMSRAGGWIAHVLEYQEDNRLIRPLSRYTGPEDQEFVPLEER